MSGLPALLSRYMNIEAGMGGISRKRRFQILVSVHNRSITPTFIFDCGHKNIHSEVRKKAFLAHSSDSYFIVFDPKLHSWIIIGRVVLTLTIHIVSLEENIPFLQLKLSVSCDSFFVSRSHCCITMPPLPPWETWHWSLNRIRIFIAYLLKGCCSHSWAEPLLCMRYSTWKEKTIASGVSILRSICST